MHNHHGPLIEPPCSPAQLRYAIRSARAVVEALILRDRDAAEAAALRTCRDCDLLIRLIRDLTHILLKAHNSPLGFDPVAAASLIRRTTHVLTLVEALRPLDGALTPSDDNRNDESAQLHRLQASAATDQRHKAESESEFDATRRQTVASLGVRVRLVPYEVDDRTGSPVRAGTEASSSPACSEAPPDTNKS